MLRLVADENFDHDIIRGLRRRHSELDFVRIQDTEVAGASDPVILDWAAHEARVLVTHDIRTIPDYAIERVKSGLSMPGVFVVKKDLSVRAAIEDLLVFIA